MRVGVGVVGAGIIFGQHAAAFAAEAGRARIVAVADVDQAARAVAATAHGVPFAYADHRSLLERDDVDVEVVATPPFLHEAVVADALRRQARAVREAAGPHAGGRRPPRRHRRGAP